MNGFELNIGTEMLKRMDEADKKLQQIASHSEEVSKAMKKLSTDGINSVVNGLSQMSSHLSKLSQDKGFSNMGTQASQSVDAINKLVEALAKLTTQQQLRLQTQQAKVDYKKEVNDLKELAMAEDERTRTLNRQNKANIANDKHRQALETKKLANDTKELMNIEQERGRQLILQNQKSIAAYTKQSIKLKQQINEINRLAKAYRQMPTNIKQVDLNKIITSASKAKTINQHIVAIHNLKNALKDLDTTSKNYQQNVSRITAEINRNKMALTQLGVNIDSVNKNKRNLMDTTGQLQRKLALLFSVSAIQGYMDKLINVRKEFELQQKSLQVLLRDKDQADKLWQQTVDLAVKSPFRIKELVNYTKQLAAYRIETSKLFDTTKMLSDVSAGLGVDMQRLILAFGQVRAANFLRGTELRQFTEAGIPMLDELATLFTELEGRAISSGEVFERISKRMVTFKDVEKVFQRMTSESGVFYNMQEEQSKTLFGMISNLHDSIDLMLNDIGRSNDGVIKDMVALTREIVDNWRAVAVVLKQVGVALGMIGISNFVSGWRLASNAIVTGSTAAVMSMNGMSGSAARLRIAMHTLGKSIKANPWLMLIGALASAGHALWEYIEAVDAANEKYDDMSRREISRTDALDDLSKKAEGYNKIIKDSNTIETERNKAIQNNNAILQQIKTKYPELESLIVKQKDGTLDLNRAIKEQNDILIENIALQQRAKGGFFQESLDTNYKEAIEEYGELESAISSFRAVAMDVQSKLSQARHNELISQEDYERFSQLLEDVRKSKDFKSLSNSYQNLVSAITRGGKEVSKQVPMLGMFARAWLNVTGKASSYSESLKDLSDNLKNQKDELKVYITDAFKEAGGGKAGKEAAGEYIESFLDKFNIVDKNIREWAKKEIPKLIKVDFDIIYPTRVPTPGELEPWAKRVKDAVDKLNAQIKASNKDVKDTDLFPVPEPGQMKEQYLNVAKDVLDVAKATYREGQKIEEDATVKRTKMLKPLASAFEAILNIDDKNKGKGKDWISEVVKGLKEAHQEYIKLNKTLGASESKQMALDKYAKSFAESAKNAGLKDISLGQFNFDTEEGAIDALEYLKDKLPESAKQARFKLEEAIGEIRGEVRIRTKAEDDKILIEQIEDMFSGYEMSIELQKLNIPPDLAKQLFNIDSIDLSGLKSRVEGLQSLFIGTDMEGKYKEYLQKIREMEDKEQVERLKSYTKYIVKAQSERTRITFDALEKIRKAEEMYAKGQFTDTEIANIRENINKERDKELADLAFNEFKNSDLYLKMFEDFDSVSIPVLEAMKERVENLRKSLKELGASSEDVKNLTQQLEKIDDAIQERNPFKDLFKNIKEYRKLQGERDKTELEYKEKLEENEKLTKALAEASKEVGTAKSEYNKAMEQAAENQTLKNAQSELDIAKARLAIEINANGAETQKAIALQQEVEKKQQAYDVTYKTLVLENKSVKTAKERLDNANKAEESAKNALNKSNTDLSALLSKLKDMEELSEKIAATLQFVGQVFQELASTVTDVASSLENVFGAMDAKTSDTISSISEILGGLGNTASGVGRVLANPMDIGGYFQAISGLASTIGSIFAIGDKKKERQIQREIELVEDLERRYQKLEKAIDNAYALNTLQRSGQQAKSNINQQISAYERMIQAEKNKKKTDHDRIKEWKQTIEDLREQKAELDKEIAGTATGGILDDVLSTAQDFTNAWLDAFNETGDGLDGLSRNFKETMLEMVKQQASMLISQAYIDKWKHQLSQYINPDDLELTTDEARRWIDSVTSSLPQLNEALERYFLAMKEAGVDLTGGNSELSGLQRGISGITEQQADILAAYLNSIRFFVSDNNTYLSRIAESLGNTEIENPMVGQLRIIAAQTSAINSLLQGLVRGGHTLGGSGLKVFIS